MGQVFFERNEAVLTFVDGTAVDNMAMATDVPLLLARLGVMHPLIVSGGGLGRSGIVHELERRSMPYVHFSGFTPNPTAEQVLAGLAAYRDNGCDGILSIGGGSAMDVAKAIKAIGDSDAALSVLERFTHPMPMDVVHVALPTTAGTGSESTHFATIYIGEKKFSVADAVLLPEVVILDASQLASLPTYERGATFMDALCHSIESYWSVRASKESRDYAAQAIRLLVANADAYLAEDAGAAGAVLVASNLAGRAINLTTTTAAHAMCYQLTIRYGLSHGHAAAECLPAAWRALVEAALDHQDLADCLEALAGLLQGCDKASAESGLAAFIALRDLAGLTHDWAVGKGADIALLAGSVNVQRLSNFPLALTEENLVEMYRQILGGA